MSSGVTEIVTSPKPRHDPNSLHSLLLPRPPVTHPRVIQGWGKKRVPGDAGLVDVVVDPILGQHLRPHQKEGVRFLYECVMGMTDINGQGAILADEMGLGKTLQTIALLWTLLKQSPFHGEESSAIKKALVVCPASLIAVSYGAFALFECSCILLLLIPSPFNAMVSLELETRVQEVAWR